MQLNPERFPVDAVLSRALQSLRECPCLVVEAPPGAGKTTRLPRAILESDLLRDGDQIWVSEPRRVAARLAARYVAEQLGGQVGQVVGYSVRHDERVGTETRLRYVTEGLLLRRLLDPASDDRARLGIVVLDEFHERHVDTDLLLLLVRQRQALDPALKLVVMSATLEGERIARHLGNCPRLRSEGRAFPLTIEHASASDERPLEARVASAVGRLLAEQHAGVLVFLPGLEEIRRAQARLQAEPALADVRVLPLHGQMPLEEQASAVAESHERKVVLATNVAESSVTVAGVTAVVDSGLARVSEHSPWTGRQRLALGEVSQASATQRAGRAGRVAPGKVLRLYTEGNFRARPEQDIPEIQRTDLSGPLLCLTAAGLVPADGDWLDAPTPRSLGAARALLVELGLLSESGQLTTAGERASAIGAHPRLAALMLRAEAFGIARKACLAAALLAERDIVLRPDPDSTMGFDCDLEWRCDLFERAEHGNFSRAELGALGLHREAVMTVRSSAKQLERELSQSRARARHPRASAVSREVGAAALPLALLAGFPERLARRRRPGGQELTLASGETARLSPHSLVQTAPLLVALDPEESSGGSGPARGAWVRWASPLQAEWLLDFLPDTLTERSEVVWDSDKERVFAANRICYRALTLEESTTPASPSPASAALLERAARAQLVNLFGDRDEVGEFFARQALLGEHFPALLSGETSGTPSAEPEASSALALLGAACQTATSLAELRNIDWLALADSSLPPQARKAFERLVPSHLTLNQRRVRIHYQAERPWVEARLQDFFGMKHGPKICDGRVPLTLHLLAPNQRAVQVTADLANFWKVHYPELRRQLSRRYPKHAWPEDGATATPPPPRPRPA